MSSRALCLSLPGLVLLFSVTGAAGQRTCDLVSSDLVVSTQTNDARVNYVSVPRFECTDGTRIEADSSVTFEATSFHQLFGNVFFRDDQRELHADRAQYFSRVGRLQAQGSVRLVNLDDGSWVTGDDLVLLQEGDGRAEDDVTVREGRPHARLVPRVEPDSTSAGDSLGTSRPEESEAPEPYEVDADLIHMVGGGLFQARGRVEVRNESQQFFGDSLEFKQDIGSLILFENARILSQDTESGDTLDVRGDTIAINLPNDQIDEIEARGGARLLATGVDVWGPLIRLVFQEEELERVFAVRRRVEEDVTPVEDLIPVTEEADQVAASANVAQPRALAEDFDLTGDSIEAHLPGGELERVTATGDARGVSTARDSLNTDTTPELIRSDWIEGDAITATFRSALADSADSGVDGWEASEPTERQLELLVARGQARSFYRSAPDSAAAADASGCQTLELNYVIGDEVRLYMKDGEVERMEVDNPTGAYLQPRCSPAPEVVSPEPGGPPGSPGADDGPLPVDNGPPGGNGGTR